MSKAVIASAALAFLAGTAHGAIYVESELNNTPATANFVGLYGPPGDSILIDGTLAPGDVDWFVFTVTGPTTFVASIFSLNNPLADSMLILVDAAGGILAFNDDGNPGGGSPYMSSLAPILLGPGTYYLGVAGYNDLGLGLGGPFLPDGINNATGAPHTQDFDYKLIVGLNITPAPGAAALLGMAGLVASRRRRAC